MTDDKKNNSDQNKYQDILNQYADQINPEPTKIDNQPKNEEQKSLKDINSLQLEAPDPILEIPSASEPQPEPEIITQSPIIPEPEIKVTSEPVVDLKEDISPDINEVKSQVDEILNYQTRSDSPDESVAPIENSLSNLPKILFFISLFIFIGIISALVYFLTSNSKSTDTSDSTSTITPTVSEAACTINGLSLGIGESFKAADGCNTCSCTAPDVIACTEMACEATPTAKVSPATKSATLTPTKSATKSAEFSVLKRVPQGVEIGDESGKILVSSPLKSISITFNNKADSKTITDDTFYVLDGIDSKVVGKITYDSKTYTATTTFSSPINISERVTVVIKGIKDSTGKLIKDLTYNIDIKV